MCRNNLSGHFATLHSMQASKRYDATMQCMRSDGVTLRSRRATSTRQELWLWARGNPQSTMTQQCKAWALTLRSLRAMSTRHWVIMWHRLLAAQFTFAWHCVLIVHSRIHWRAKPTKKCVSKISNHGWALTLRSRQASKRYDTTMQGMSSDSALEAMHIH